MNLRTRTWFIISLLFFVAAAIFWQLGERKVARDKAAREAALPATAPDKSISSVVTNTPGALPATNALNVATNDSLRLRLSNTSLNEDALLNRDSALLLMNALVDTASSDVLNIPAHLRAQGDPGSYVVQARGAIDDAFRAELKRAGAEIVSYVPNNAYLVRASAAVAEQLRASPQTQAVLAWEPYFKLEDELLALAVEQKPLPVTRQLNVLVYTADRAEVDKAFAAMKVVVLQEERSPFGTQLVVRPPRDGVVALAQLPGVQHIELNRPRRAANDQARVRMRVTTNALASAPNFRGMTGKGVLVNVNDTGVDGTHPDLSGRVNGIATDIEGHGTHVAGTIASSGASSPTGYIPGSITNATFRGIAYEADIFSLFFSGTDAALQEGPASTNALISNNSWGYPGSGGYSLAAASWDAAVRDALPGVEGSQPLLAVFSAGNSGEAGIDAPGSAKNVITVGALENLRNITNEVTVIEYTETNKFQPWLANTDSSNQVAGFSSVGNIGRRREGQSGRFKPDVVAPGTFTISTRAANWVQPTNLYSFETTRIPLVSLDPDENEIFSVYVPLHGVQIDVLCEPNQFTGANGLPSIPIYVQEGTAPAIPGTAVGDKQATVGPPLAPVPPGTWYVGVENKGTNRARFDVRITVTITNNLGNEPEQLFNLNQALAPYYRYESGTSMAAPAVSGALALMQQYFATLGATNSPALMKALVINGARNANEDAYDFNVNPDYNRQGWGLVNITNSVPGTATTAPSYNSSEKTFTSPTMACFDQSVSRALATGQSFTRSVNIAANARTSPLRFSLVWTDPPGNPSVGVKLVNDLDLTVSNNVTGEIYAGNAFGPGNYFSPFSGTNTTNGLVLDRVNNVENVYINASLNARLGASYTVMVSAKRVNVNSVNGHPDGVVQDFALVISHGNPRTFTGSAITVGNEPIIDVPAPEVTVVTNGVPILNQRAGANSPLYLLSTNGVAAQWHFFVVTNRLPSSDPMSNAPVAAATNIAFATFLPPNLSRERTNRSDIDLYVSKDSDLMNLVPSVIEASRRSLKRGGTESVVLGLADGLAGGEIFYVGVKSEDQQAANFGFFAISSSSPFSSEDSEGNVYMDGFPFNVEIPDGRPEEPQAGFMFAFNTREIVIQNVVVTNWITHTNGGDLFGSLDLDGGKISVLNNNRSFSTVDGSGNLIPYRFIYDDSDSGEIDESIRTDTPGTLRNFVGEDGTGTSWRLTMVDSTPRHTGQVNRLQIRLEPRKDDLTNGVGIVETILPGRFFYTVVDVEATVTNLQVCATPDAGLVEVYIRRAGFPDRDNYDMFGVVVPPGDCVNLGLRDSPPLSRGRYYIGIFNPNAVAVTVGIKVNLQHDLRKGVPLRFRGGNGELIVDDALTTSTQFVGYSGIISDVDVGVRIAHERVSDLVLHLVSPEGTRLLLTENRGRNTADYGLGSLITNVVPVQSSGSNAPVTNIIVTTQTEGTLQLDYNFYGLPDRITVYYEGVRLLDTGLISGSGTLSVDYGPGTSTNIVIVANEGGNPAPLTLWDYVAVIYNSYTYSTFTENTERARLPIKFEPPPFTNFNYFQTNYVTNVTLVADGFEDRFSAHRIIPAPQFLTGWQVTTGSVEVVTNAISLSGSTTNSSWFLPAYEGSRLVDLNGLTAGAIATNLSTVPGTSYRVSYAYAKHPGDPYPAVAEILWKGTNGVGGSEVVTASVSSWSRGEFFFNAVDSVTKLELVSASIGIGSPAINDTGVLFDDIRVENISTNIVAGMYYHPEEPLTPFFGQNAFGNWTLEVLDNRAGGGLTNALLGWRLNLTFVNTNPPTTRLSNNVESCVTLLTDETAYFYVDVPITASAATNIVVASDQVDVFYNQSGLPALNEPPDTAFFYNVLSGETVLGIDGWNSYETGGIFAGGAVTPTIAPGKRYYLALRNRGSGTNSVCVRVAFDELSPNLVGIIPLTNQCYTYTGVATNAGVIDYYSFDVSTNAIGVRFSVSNIIGDDVNLVVSRGLPLPNDARFGARSANAAAAQGEIIEVADFFQTALSGRWYVGVIHTSANPVGYTVCAEEVGGPITEVFDRQLRQATNNPAGSAGDVAYYRVYIPPTGFSTNGVFQPSIVLAEFQLTNIFAGRDMDLYLSSSTMQPLYAAPTNWLVSSTNFSPLNNFESNSISAFSTSISLTPGWWFIAAVNKSPAPTDYGVAVTMYGANLPYILLTNGMAYCDSVVNSNDLAFYQFDVSPDALQVAFEVFNQSGPDVDLFAHPLFPVPPAGFFPFIDRSSTNGYPTNEFIGGNFQQFSPIVNPVPGIFNPFAFTGPWYLTVKSKATNTSFPAGFCVRATEITERDVQPLTNGLAVCRTMPAVDANALYAGVQFHSIDVVGVPLQATFETFGASGNVDLYVQRNLPFTNFTSYSSGGGASLYPYFSEKAGALDEYICLGTNSSPVSLAPGRWYVVVVNRDAAPVDYCLRASFVSSQNLVRIGNGELFCNSGLSVTNGGPISGQDYYVFRVATNAVQAMFETISMSGNVDLFLTTNLCVTNFSTYDPSLAPYPYYSTNLGTLMDAICVLTNSAPVKLAPGDWYLTVVNREPSTPVSYCVRATQLMSTNFIVVTNSGAICRTVAVNNGTAAAGIDYYILDVSGSPVLMNFQTYNADGNVDLYVTHDPCLPNFAAFDSTGTNYPYASTQPGTSAECLSVTATSVPQGLTNGLWYAAVVNRSTNPVSYCFLATPFATDPAPPLTNGLALCSQTANLPSGTNLVGANYYVFDVPVNALQVTYEVYAASGNVDLYVNDGFCFENRDTFSLATTNAAYASTNTGTAEETVVVSVASSPASLVPGTWYLAVVNRDGTPATFCVKATALLTTDVVGLTNGIGYSTPFAVPAGEVRRYYYTIAPNAIQATFEVLNPSGDVDLYVEKGLAPADIYGSSYGSATLGTVEERVIVGTNSSPTPLAPGVWFLAVTNSSALPVIYTVRVSEILDNGLVRLFSGTSFSNTVAGVGSLTGLPADYYVFTVSNEAVRAQFEVTSPNGDVTLVARQGLPLPDLSTATIWSTNGGNSSELISLLTNSTPVALTPGEWYVGVLNNTNAGVSYRITATQYFSAGTNIVPGPITITSNLFCASYTGVLPGVNYYVEGAVNFNPPIIWVPVTPTIKATSTTLNWCITLPSPYSFFRVREGLSPLSAASSISATASSVSPSSVSFQWNAPAGQRFVVEYTDTLFPPDWKPYPAYITSINGVCVFTDDGSLTGGRGSNRYYRFFPVP